MPESFLVIEPDMFERILVHDLFSDDYAASLDLTDPVCAAFLDMERRRH